MKKIFKSPFLKLRSRGVVIPTLALFFVVLIGMAALAFDLTMAYVAFIEIDNAARLCALAAARRLIDTTPRITGITDLRNAVNAITTYNGTLENRITARRQWGSVIVLAEDVTSGVYNFQNRNYTATNTPTNVQTNAVRVTVRTGGGNDPFIFRLARVLGFENILMTRTATVAVAPFLSVVAIDISSSTDDGRNSQSVALSYPHCYPDATACGFTHPDYDDWRDRNFRRNPRQNFNLDPTIWLGGRPWPAYELWGAARDALFTNQFLFNAAYNTSLSDFGTLVTREIPLDLAAPNNAAPVRDFVTAVLNDTDFYRMQENNTLFADGSGYTFSPRPFIAGGDNPLGNPGTGHTNIGGAIFDARNALNTTATAIGFRSLLAIFLITDGTPDCDSAGVCSSSPAGIAAGRAYATAQASAARNESIFIYTMVIVNTATECTAAGSPGQYLSSSVAYAPTYAFCRTSVAQLATDMANLRRPPALVLV